MKVKETNTYGRYAYLVAQYCGEKTEASEDDYHNYQLIYADSQDKAKEKYNELNNCYGSIICEVVGEAKELFKRDIIL